MKPKPYSEVLCTVCDQIWEAHLALTATHEPDPRDEWAVITTFGDVTLEQCVELLKKANAGPPGPPGPMGATGRPGKDAA